MASIREQIAASASGSRKVSDVVLRISFDWGTVNLNSAYHIAPPGQRAELNNIYHVEFVRSKHHAPMAGGWLDSGEFSCGFELDNALTTEHASYDNVIRLVKLALYDSHKTSELVKKITNQLNNHNMKLTSFIAEHLKRSYYEVIAHIKRTPLNESHNIDNLEKEIYISVPQMWTPSSCKIMMDAAKMAGFPKTELVPEPLCAAAFTNEGMRTFGRHVADAMQYSQLKPGDVIQVADLGGGTGDFTSYELFDAGEEDAYTGLRAVGTPQGALCGSEFINLAFLKWLEHCPVVEDLGGIANTCRAMDLTRAAFDAKASAEFERIKTKYPWAPVETVSFGGGPNRRFISTAITVTRDQLTQWFDELIDDDIIPQINKQIRSVEAETKLIIVPGGFGSSQYLMDRLRARYDPRDASFTDRIKIYDDLRVQGKDYLPVPTGLLLHFQQIIQRGVPAAFTFGVTQVEEWDPLHHPDATLRIGRSTVGREDMVMIDPVDSEMEIVEDRFVTLVAKGSLTKPGENAADVSKMQYVHFGEDANITIPVFWTDRNIKDHDPINDKDGNLLPGIQLWTTSTVKFDPAVKGFRLQKRSDGKQVYEVWWNLSLVFEGANASIKWQIMKPGKVPYGYDGVFKDRLRDRDVLRREVLSIAEEEYNPFVRV